MLPSLICAELGHFLAIGLEIYYNTHVKVLRKERYYVGKRY